MEAEKRQKDLSKRYRMRPVVAVAPDGGVAGYFDCIVDAAEVAGVVQSAIQTALKSGGFCKKLRWMYEEDYRRIWQEGGAAALAYNRREEKSRKAVERARNFPPEVKERQARKISEYQRKKYREDPGCHLRKLQEAHRRPIRCITTGEEFVSITEFCNRYGINPSNARQVLIGLRRHTKGMKIEYINPLK